MLAKISRKNQITIPAEVRRHLRLHSGEYVQFTVEAGEVKLKAAKQGIETLKGAVAIPGRQDFTAARHRAMEEMASERIARNRR